MVGAIEAGQGPVGRVGRPEEHADAVVMLVSNGNITSTALDVWWNEPEAPTQSSPPSSLPFNELDNVIMSPHTSATTTSMLHNRVQFFAEQVRRVATGEPLDNVVYTGH